MNAFLPDDMTSLAVALAIVLPSLIAAFIVSRLPATRTLVFVAWLVPVAVIVALEVLFADEPPGLRMLVMIFGVLFGMKGVVSIEACRAGERRLKSLAWICFAAGWPGMRPVAFADVPGAPKKDATSYLIRGLVNALAGVAFALAAHRASISREFLTGDWLRLVATFMLLLPGLSLILHFGIFSVLAGAWRMLGADCRPLFRDPIRSKSLTEFWSRRWNLAFSEMAAIAVFRPLRASVGKRAASFATFVFSGILHELAISLPVHAGYGLPLLYFLLQGAAVMWEERLARLGRPIDARPWIGRLWSITWLVLPLPMLFHPAFLKGIVLPLIGA